MKHIGVSFKSECDTRWCSKHAAVKAVYVNIDKLIELLNNLVSDNMQSDDTPADSDVVLQNICNHSFLVLLNYWSNLLEKINRVQQRLQDPKINFKDAALDIKTKCAEYVININRRIRRKKKMPGEKSSYIGLSAEQLINRVMKESIDRLVNELKTRFQRLEDLDDKYGFLLK